MAESQAGELQMPQRILLGPGPSSVHPRVLQAMMAPVVGHLDPTFFQVMDDVREMLRQVYHTSNLMTFPVSPPRGPAPWKLLARTSSSMAIQLWSAATGTSDTG
jgi:hypothetical protein